MGFLFLPAGCECCGDYTDLVKRAAGVGEYDSAKQGHKRKARGGRGGVSAKCGARYEVANAMVYCRKEMMATPNAARFRVD